MLIRATRSRYEAFVGASPDEPFEDFQTLVEGGLGFIEHAGPAADPAQLVERVAKGARVDLGGRVLGPKPSHDFDVLPRRGLGLGIAAQFRQQVGEGSTVAPGGYWYSGTVGWAIASRSKPSIAWRISDSASAKRALSR